MVAEYNALLAADGWEIHAVKEISGKPVYGYRRAIDSARPHLQEATRVAAALSGALRRSAGPSYAGSCSRKTPSLP